MRPTLIASIGAAALIAGCGSAVQVAGAPAAKPAGDRSTAAVRIAGAPAPPPQAYDAPPQRFVERDHPARPRSAVNAPVDLAALPGMQLRLEQCYPEWAAEQRWKREQEARRKREARQAAIAARKARQRKGRKVPRVRVGAATVSGSSVGTSYGYGGLGIRGTGQGGGGTGQGTIGLGNLHTIGHGAGGGSGTGYGRGAGAAAPASPFGANSALGSNPEVAMGALMGESADDSLPPGYADWGAGIYLSNDDTMSLSSAQRVIYAIDNFMPLPPEHIRPHELLNYFSFRSEAAAPRDEFAVHAELAPDPAADDPGAQTLALAVRGRSVDRTSRRNAALTLVVDRSGSMSDQGRLDYVKRGLERMTDELKEGDVVNLVIFDDVICAPVEGFVVGRDPRAKLEQAIDLLQPRNSTDVHGGLTRGYQIADARYRPDYSNRVLLITDALTNTGVTDERLIALASDYYDRRRIRLSGIGVGREFNDSLLDRLTERGKGAYLFLGSESEVDAAFGERFVSLIETTALNVRFKLQLPASLRMDLFYGEESSTVKEDVQQVHYFAGTDQLFLADLIARGGALRPQDDLRLTIEYEDPESGDELFEDHVFNLGAIATGAAPNVRKGRLLMAWVEGLAELTRRPLPDEREQALGTWVDAEGWQRCAEDGEQLDQLAAGIDTDPEVGRVIDLWQKFCSRYEPPRQAARREVAARDDSWPGAQP